jgi:predicted nucleic acid-binding protein
VKRYPLSFWDALLWATIREAEITTLLSEDSQQEQLLDGVQIINPFRIKDIGELLT